MEETWENVGMEQFRGLYEISSLGRVRVKPYKFFKNGILEQGKSRILMNYDKQVFLYNGLYRRLYKVGVLFNETYKKDI